MFMFILVERLGRGEGREKEKRGGEKGTERETNHSFALCLSRWSQGPKNVSCHVLPHKVSISRKWAHKQRSKDSPSMLWV